MSIHILRSKCCHRVDKGWVSWSSEQLMSGNNNWDDAWHDDDVKIPCWNFSDFISVIFPTEKPVKDSQLILIFGNYF